MKTFHRNKTVQRLHIMGSSMVFTIALTACAGIPAPTSQLAVSHAAVSSASAAGANEFSPLPLRSAQEKLDAAEQAMTKHDYLLARELAEEAEVDAKLSMVSSRTVKAQKAENQLQQDNNVLRQEINRKTQ
jgi:hypothetical protein